MEFSQMKLDMFFETSSKAFEGLVELGIRQSAVYQVILAAIEVDGVSQENTQMVEPKLWTCEMTVGDQSKGMETPGESFI